MAKRTLAGQIGLSVALSLTTWAATAQTAATPGASVGAQLQGLQGQLGIQAGNYNFQSYDKGRLQDFVLNQMRDAQNADREFILTKTAEIELAVNSFIKETINGHEGLQNLSDNAFASGQGSLDLTTILMAKRNYDVAHETVLNKLASIKALPSAMKKEEPVSLEGSGIVQLRTNGQVDLTQIISFYQSQIDKIAAQVSTIKFTTGLPNGTPLIQKSLTEIMAAIQTSEPFSPEKVREMTDKEISERTISTETKTKLEAHFRQVLKLVMQYVNDFGTDQQWRANTTPEERQNILTELEQAFWSNSFLRAAYAVPLGAIGINFRAQKFNAEYLFASNQMSFQSEPVRQQDKIDSERRTLLVALGVMDKRDDNILAAETPLINKILSGLTILNGNWQLAEVNVQILKLLYADMAEEGILATQGYEAMRAHYQTRWYAGRSEAEVEAIRKRADDWVNADQVNMDNIRGTFRFAAAEGEKYLTHLQAADGLRAQIAAFKNSSDVSKKYHRPL